MITGFPTSWQANGGLQIVQHYAALLDDHQNQRDQNGEPSLVDTEKGTQGCEKG
ncbi:hypothetical protein ACFP81_15200 [Deinococcus lacus]|uniref:Uncharacterized protein n=1 Tax=Deinococcus lacus TaxID=392561 RepID=A0ABW1YI43_9DEIO